MPYMSRFLRCRSITTLTRTASARRASVTGRAPVGVVAARAICMSCSLSTRQIGSTPNRSLYWIDVRSLGVTEPLVVPVLLVPVGFCLGSVYRFAVGRRSRRRRQGAGVGQIEPGRRGALSPKEICSFEHGLDRPGGRRDRAGFVDQKLCFEVGALGGIRSA